MDNTYTLKTSERQIKIYINDILHLAIRQDELVSVQSWIMGYGVNRRYKIEYTTKTQTIESGYDTIEKWHAILNLLDANNIYGNN